MKKIKDIVQHIAPTLASAMGGPLSGVAIKFITDHFDIKDSEKDTNSEEMIIELLMDSKNLLRIKALDEEFKLEMKKLDIDVFSLEIEAAKEPSVPVKSNKNPHVIISILFLVMYFLILAAIFFVEVSDSLNMHKGDNSLIGELQILFGVLTAGVGQTLSYWFGNRREGKRASSE